MLGKQPLGGVEYPLARGPAPCLRCDTSIFDWKCRHCSSLPSVDRTIRKDIQSSV